MNWKMKWFNILIISLCCFACSKEKKTEKTSRVTKLPYYQEASFTPFWLRPGAELANDFHEIPKFQLINQEGHIVTNDDLDGKIYVADFFFTVCPGICPKMTANMGILQEAYLDDEEVMLISHSVTPEYDSVSVLKRYAEDKEIDSKTWWLLTGGRDMIYDLGRNQYFAEEDQGLTKDFDDFLHTENFLLIDKERHIRGIYNGLRKNDIQQLIADIETLKKEG